MVDSEVKTGLDACDVASSRIEGPSFPQDKNSYISGLVGILVPLMNKFVSA